MPTFAEVARAFAGAREHNSSALGRLHWWAERFGDCSLSEITPDDVDDAIAALVARGKTKTVNRQPVPTGEPLSGPTINRYINTLGSVFKFAKDQRLVRRSFIPPTQGVPREKEESNPDRYFRPEEVERLITAAKVADVRWGKLVALIEVAYCTGLRKNNVLQLHWGDVDLAAGTVSVKQTKNGTPQVSALSARAIKALERLPGQRFADGFVFASSRGQPLDIRKLWAKTTQLARLQGRVFHELRHGCGFRMAVSGVSQQMIMQVMNHKTLTASARYAHANANDKRAVVAQVFT
jgi:integrase